MIRLALAYGPQRGSDVRQWVTDASGFGVKTFRNVADEMVVRGDLVRGVWVLGKLPLSESLIEGLNASIKAREPTTAPLVPPGEVLAEMVYDELRELMGDV